MTKTKRNRPRPNLSLASPAPRRGPLTSRAGSTAAVIAVKTLTLGAVLFAYYVLTFYTAIQVVPTIFGFVKAGTGLTMDMGFDTIIAVWIAPSLFLVALLFVAVLLAMRGLWRLRSRAVTAFMAWTDPDHVPEGTVPTRSAMLDQPRRNETQAV